jgi:glutaminyl-tRNA synthetase
MGVLRPLRLVIENCPEDRVEDFECPNHPQNSGMGSRTVPFSRVLYIERDDFQEHPPKKYNRLGPGREVRLRYAYVVKCVDMVKDEKTGEVVEVRATYDPETRNASPKDGHKVEGVIHWVSDRHSVPAEVRLYDRLFQVANPMSEGDDFTKYLNPKSLETLTSCRVESGLAGASPGSKVQFERLGYFCVDLKDSSPQKLVFNRIATLRDSWAKIAGHTGRP